MNPSCFPRKLLSLTVRSSHALNWEERSLNVDDVAIVSALLMQVLKLHCHINYRCAVTMPTSFLLDHASCLGFPHHLMALHARLPIHLQSELARYTLQR